MKRAITPDPAFMACHTKLYTPSQPERHDSSFILHTKHEAVLIERPKLQSKCKSASAMAQKKKGVFEEEHKALSAQPTVDHIGKGSRREKVKRGVCLDPSVLHINISYVNDPVLDSDEPPIIELGISYTQMDPPCKKNLVVQKPRLPVLEEESMVPLEARSSHSGSEKSTLANFGRNPAENEFVMPEEPIIDTHKRANSMQIFLQNSVQASVQSVDANFHGLPSLDPPKKIQTEVKSKEVGVEGAVNIDKNIVAVGVCEITHAPIHNSENVQPTQSPRKIIIRNEHKIRIIRKPRHPSKNTIYHNGAWTTRVHAETPEMDSHGLFGNSATPLLKKKRAVSQNDVRAAEAEDGLKQTKTVVVPKKSEGNIASEIKAESPKDQRPTAEMQKTPAQKILENALSYPGSTPNKNAALHALSEIKERPRRRKMRRKLPGITQKNSIVQNSGAKNIPRSIRQISIRPRQALTNATDRLFAEMKCPKCREKLQRNSKDPATRRANLKKYISQKRGKSMNQDISNIMNDRITLKEYLENSAIRTPQRKYTPLMKDNQSPCSSNIPQYRLKPIARVNQYQSSSTGKTTLRIGEENNNFWGKRVLGSRVGEYLKAVPPQPAQTAKRDSLQNFLSTEPSSMVGYDTPQGKSSQRVSDLRKRLNVPNPPGKMPNRTVVFNNKEEDAKKHLPYGMTDQNQNSSNVENKEKTSLQGNSTQIDWARSMLYWNVKRGCVNFNAEQDTEVYYDFELSHVLATIKNRVEEVSLIQEIKPFHAKARSTMKKLTTELLIGHLFYNMDAKCFDATVENTVKYLEKCKELFVARKILIPIFILANERDNLVTRDIIRLINLGYIEESQKNYLKSLVNSLCQTTNKIVKKVGKFRQECPLFDQDFILNNYSYVQVCQTELEEILSIMEKKHGYRPPSPSRSKQS